MTSLVNQEDVTATIKAKLEGASITKIIGQPDIHSYNILEKELCIAAAMIKTNQPNRGNGAGMSYLVLDDTRLQAELNDVNITTTRMVEPPNLHPQLNDEQTGIQTMQLQTAQKERKYDYCKQEAVCGLLVLMIADAVEDEWIATLKHALFKWNGVTCKALLSHIKVTWCKITTVSRTNAKKFFALPWDSSMSLLFYERQQDLAQKRCVEVGASAPDEDKLQTFVESMYASHRFNEDDLSKWENKADDQKTYATAYAYFLKLDNNHKTFAKNVESARNGFESALAMRGQSAPSDTSSIRGGGGTSAIQGSTSSGRGIDGGTFTGRSSNNLNVRGDRLIYPDEPSALDDYTTALEDNLSEATEVIAALKDNHEVQLRELKDANAVFQAQQVKMMEMFTKQLAIQTGGVCGTAAGGGGTAAGGGKERKKKRKCGVCGVEGYHEDDECFKLDKNKEKRPDWYKKKYGE